MTTRTLTLLSASLLLTACSGTVEKGALTLCASSNFDGGDDVVVAVSGTVTAVDDGVTGCSADVTLEDADGEAWSLGLTVLDESDADITPGLDLAVDDEVDLTWRYRMVWGDVTGFAISDAEGLAIAADEGAWGGALLEEDTPGLSVQRGADPVAEERTSCEPIEGYEVVFEADEELALTAVDSATLPVDGVDTTAMAIRATEYGESRTCETSDTTGFLTWLVVR